VNGARSALKNALAVSALKRNGTAGAVVVDVHQRIERILGVAHDRDRSRTREVIELRPDEVEERAHYQLPLAIS
jgi:hypothetical protein